MALNACYIRPPHILADWIWGDFAVMTDVAKTYNLNLVDVKRMYSLQDIYSKSMCREIHNGI